MIRTDARAAFLLFALVAAPSFASTPFTPAALLPFQPAGLAFGEPYQLVFATRDERDALSSNIADYNDFVNTEADQAGIGPATAGVSWFAIASTPTVDARDNAVVTAPTFNFQGEPLAVDANDMWDGELLNAVAYDENGAANIGFTLVWTGSLSDGTGRPDRQLGAISSELGDITGRIARWIQNTNGAPNVAHHFYALSEPLLAVPEPTALVLLGVASVGCACQRRRRR